MNSDDKRREIIIKIALDTFQSLPAKTREGLTERLRRKMREAGLTPRADHS